MTPVVIGMLICLVAAVVVLAVVALPQLRSGAPFLSGEGEEAVREARRRARALAAQARERTLAAQARERDEDGAEPTADERDDRAAGDARDDRAVGDERVGHEGPSGGSGEPARSAGSPDEVVDVRDDDSAVVTSVRAAAAAEGGRGRQAGASPATAPVPARAPTGTGPVTAAPSSAASATSVPSADQEPGRPAAATPRAVRRHPVDEIDLRDDADLIPPTGRRGAHRRLVDLGWGDPVPGARHGRRQPAAGHARAGHRRTAGSR